MKNSPEILNELMSVSPLIAGLEKINVFRVPEGYFNELHLRLANYAILNNLSPVENIIKRNIQEVPAGYFDSLSDSILAKVKAVAYPESAREEIMKLSSLLSGAQVKNVFTVPEGYFDNLTGAILSKLNSTNSESASEEIKNLSPLLFSLKEKNLFVAPPGYFNGLSSLIVEMVNPEYSENAQEELRKLSPLLYSLQGENVFTVPRNYFESLPRDITGILESAPAKIVSMSKRTSWLKYAAAAVVTGIITITSLQLFKGSSDTDIASLPDYIQASFKYKTEADINAGIAKLDDADIAKYLEKNGNVLDNELLIKNTDVSEMPSESDYLKDENTLNEYLDKIENKNDSKLTP